MGIDRSKGEAPTLTQQVDGLYDDMRLAPTAQDPEELVSALQLVEATVVEGISIALAATGRTPRQERAEAQRNANAHDDNLQSGSQLIPLAFGALLRDREAIDEALDPAQGDPDLFAWLREQRIRSGMSQGALAGRLNMDAATLSRHLRNLRDGQMPRVEAETIARHTLRAQKSLSQEERDERMAALGALYDDYEAWWRAKREAALIAPEPHSLGESAQSLAELKPILLMLGTTTLQGLGVLSGEVTRMRDPYRIAVTKKIIGKHYTTLDAYLGTACLSVGAIEGDPDAVDRMLDPTHDLPGFLRLLHKHGIRTRVTQRDVTLLLDLTESKVSRTLSDRHARLLPADTAEEWLQLLAKEGGLTGEKRQDYVTKGMTLYAEYKVYKERQAALPKSLADELFEDLDDF